MLEVKFYQNERLTDMSFYGNPQSEMIVIVPSPIIADQIRAGFLEQNSSSVPSVITISKFMQDELSLSKVPDDQKKLMGKAELILNLARLWKMHLSHLPFDMFLKAYNHFSELRSHSLRMEIVAPIIERLDPELAKAVQLFWLVIEAMNIVDEHKAYDVLAQYYRTDLIGEEVNKKTLVFLDFTFLSGLQLDLINSLAIKHEVIVPFPEEVYPETTHEDWIRWLVNDHESKKIHADKLPLKYLDFPKKKLSQTLKNYLKDEDADFILSTKQLEDQFIFEIPVGNAYFKAEASIFSEEYNELKNQLKKINFPISTDEFKKLLIEKKKNSLDGKKNFRQFKIVTLLLEITKSYEELSAQEIKIELFDMKVLLHVLQLKLPRTFLVPLIETKNVSRILDLKNIQSFNPDKTTYLCLGSDYTPIKLAENILTEFDYEILNTVGPIKRNKLDFLMTKIKLKKVLSSPNTTLLIEHDFHKHDLGWSDILSQYDLKKVEGINPESFAFSDYEKIFKKRNDLKNTDLSANRVQTYLDCPQKFYYDHLEQLRPRISLESGIQYSELGTIEHDVIEHYMKLHRHWDAHKMLEVTHLRLTHYLKNKQIKLIPQEFTKYSIEICLLAGHAVQFLNRLEVILGKCEYFFEYPLELTEDNWKVRIRIDCLIKTPQGNILLDFKRSNSSVPDGKQFENFEKIQLWFYLHYLKIPASELALVGYLNLMQPEESLFYSPENGEQFSALNLKIKSFPKSFSEMMDEFSQFLDETKSMMAVDKDFFPIPKDPDSCRYCSVAAVCSRKNGAGQ